MNNIPYKYEITAVHNDGRWMEVVYTSPGRDTHRVAVRLPYENESLEAVIHSFAPLPHWYAKEAPVQDIQAGTTGSYTPDDGPKLSLFERTRLGKLAEIADWRYMHEIRGVLVDGIKVRTDRTSQAQLTSAYISLTQGLVETIQWKGDDGTFRAIGLEEVQKMLEAVNRHVQACFAAEALLVEQVNAARSVEEIQGIQLPEILYTGDT